MEDIFIHYIDFKNSIPATSTCNEDGSYSVFINSRISNEQQVNGYIHELKHILKQDFECRIGFVDRIEYYAHNMIC